METNSLEVSLNTIIFRKTNIIFNEFDEEIVILSIDNEEYYNLNPVGSLIWKLIEEPIKLEKIISTLIDQFAVSESVCKIETISYITELSNLGIIILNNE